MYLELVVLALLVDKPKYGYELKKEIELSYNYVTEVNTNTIYPIMRKFEKNGWTQKKVIPVEGKPNRHVYTITSEGRKQLVSRLRNFDDSIFNKPEEILIRLVYFDWMDIDSRRKILDGRERVINNYQINLQKLGKQKWVHPLIEEYGEKSRTEELELICKYRKLIDSPVHMDNDGNII